MTKLTPKQKKNLPDKLKKAIGKKYTTGFTQAGA